MKAQCLKKKAERIIRTAVGRDEIDDFAFSVIDFLDALKEQETVKPVITPWVTDDDGNVIVARTTCGKCGWQFFTEEPNYCENCGIRILWEGR